MQNRIEADALSLEDEKSHRSGTVFTANESIRARKAVRSPGQERMQFQELTVRRATKLAHYYDFTCTGS